MATTKKKLTAVWPGSDGKGASTRPGAPPPSSGGGHGDLSPGARPSKAVWIARINQLYLDLLDGAADGVKKWPIYVTRSWVLAHWDTAVQSVESGGYGVPVTDLAMTREELEQAWLQYVWACWPEHVQTPGSPAWQDVESQGGRHETAGNPWLP